PSTYDTCVPDEPAQPPTRADLALHTRAARQPFPVGLATEGTTVAIGADSYPGIPDHLVVRPSDMRIVGFISGSGTGYLAKEVRSACAAPNPGAETIVRASAPRAIRVDGASVYVA